MGLVGACVRQDVVNLMRDCSVRICFLRWW